MEENQNTQDQNIENQEFAPETHEEESQNETVGTLDCQEQIEAEKEKYVRLFAEFDNFKKRTHKEKLDFYKYANQDTLIAMLPIIDDFERALKQMKTDEADEKVLEGVELIYQKFYNTLKEKGLEKIEIQAGDDFDVESQEAITQIETEDADLKNKVVDVIETGYKLGDKVIRFAKVVTGK